MKKKWIIILGTCVIIAFTVQVISYLSFIKKQFLGNNGAESETIFDFQVTIGTFLSVCNKYDAPVIPVDQETLRGFQNYGSNYIDKLIATYKHSNVFPFITFNEVFDNKVINSLTERGFIHSTTSQADAKLLSQNIVRQRVLHHIFTLNRFAIHVTVCYHRDGNFWWHGSFVYSDVTPPMLHFSSGSFGFAREEGAYDEFPITLKQKEFVKVYLPSNISNFLHQIDNSRYIECNHTRSNIFYSRYKMDVSNDAMEFRAVAWKILRLAKSVLEKLNVRFWLSSGTCLGYFRQCDIFPYSKDIDIGIFIKEYHPQMITGFLGAGMILKHKLGKIEDSLELSFTLDGIKLDIFFFYEEADYVWNGGLQVKSGKKFKYIFPTFNLCWTEFIGLKVSVPCQTESYIIANYGPNWFQPVMQWDWKTSPFNVHENGVWPEKEWDEVIQLGDY